MFKRVAFAFIIATSFAWIGPVRAQSGKIDFADAMKALQKCRVDDLRAMFTGSPTGSVDAQTAMSSANNKNVDPTYVRDADGTPVLIAAAATDCTEGVHVLLNSGADITSTDKNGRTALHAAAASSTESMVKLLVERNADVNAKTATGDTPLSLAKTNTYKGKTDQRDKIVKFLTSKGAKDKS